MHLKLRPSLFLLTVLTLGCGAPQDAPEPVASDETACEATFRWLQKDAYANRAGRRSERWPAHTTTEIRVRCEDGFEASAEKTNHGTAVDATTEVGEPLLVEAHRETKAGTREEFEALLAAFGDCDCAPVTEFFGLETLQEGERSERWVEAVADYAGARLACEAPVTPAEVVGHLRADRVDQALAILEVCAWGEGASWEQAFQAAFDEVVDDAARYHVCNNDAVLQAGLWERFQTGEPLPTCEGRETLCRGPRWYYVVR